LLPWGEAIDLQVHRYIASMQSIVLASINWQ
jgi:hypothetical protein